MITECIEAIKNNLITIIPIIISILSLVISSILAFRTWWAERFKLDFEMIKWFGYSNDRYPMYLWLNISNYSKLPCSVLEIKIKNIRNGRMLTGSGTGAGRLITTTKMNDEEIKKVYSVNYPIKVDPYTSIGGYFHVFSDAGFFNFEENTIEVTLRTTRGEVTKKIFMDRGKNIYRVLQHNDPSIKTKFYTREDGSTIDYLMDTNI